MSKINLRNEYLEILNTQQQLHLPMDNREIKDANLIKVILVNQISNLIHKYNLETIYESAGIFEWIDPDSKNVVWMRNNSTDLDNQLFDYLMNRINRYILDNHISKRELELPELYQLFTALYSQANDSIETTNKIYQLGITIIKKLILHTDQNIRDNMDKIVSGFDIEINDDKIYGNAKNNDKYELDTDDLFIIIAHGYKGKLPKNLQDENL